MASQTIAPVQLTGMIQPPWDKITFTAAVVGPDNNFIAPLVNRRTFVIFRNTHATLAADIWYRAHANDQGRGQNVELGDSGDGSVNVRMSLAAGAYAQSGTLVSEGFANENGARIRTDLANVEIAAFNI